MKRLIILFLTISISYSFSQGSKKNQISWLELEKAKILAKKYNQNILIYFYKDNCPYCDKMKATFNDPQLINTINRNFLPVKINSRTKDTIYYMNQSYTNQQPINHGYTWRHDFYAEVASFTKNGTKQSTTPSIVIFDEKFDKIDLLPGNKPKELLLRILKKYLK